MALNELLNATVKKTGNYVEVYRQFTTGNFVDYKDCKTIYTEKELIFTKLK